MLIASEAYASIQASIAFRPPLRAPVSMLLERLVIFLPLKAEIGVSRITHRGSLWANSQTYHKQTNL